MHISYKRAISWIAHNEDLSYIDKAAEGRDAVPVTVAFCADMFGKEDTKVAQDVLKESQRQGAEWDQS